MESGLCWLGLWTVSAADHRAMSCLVAHSDFPTSIFFESRRVSDLFRGHALSTRQFEYPSQQPGRVEIRSRVQEPRHSVNLRAVLSRPVVPCRRLSLLVGGRFLLCFPVRQLSRQVATCRDLSQGSLPKYKRCVSLPMPERSYIFLQIQFREGDKRGDLLRNIAGRCGECGGYRRLHKGQVRRL